MTETTSKWMIHTKKADFDGWAKKFDISPVTARVLRNRDLCADEEIDRFLHADMKDMHDPFLMKDMEKAAGTVKTKITEGKKIRIVGDYDADGVSASVILYKGLKSLGALVDTDVPDRIKDGYGINKRIVDDALNDGVDTIITCDNGIAAIDTVAYAKEKGLTVIVTDHHEPQDTLPPADAVINPKQKDCTYPYTQLCGAGIAYKFIVALDAGGDVLHELLKFAAIATVCDVVELKDENRIIAKNGIRLINEEEAVSGKENVPGFNKGLHALIEKNDILNRKIGVYHIGFIIGPCINAGGRLGSAKTAISLFLEDDTDRCTAYAADLTEQNALRKEMTEGMVRKACEVIDKEYDDNVIVVYMPDCHEAIAGIVAGRIKDRFYRPTFVMTDAEGGLVKASGRSIDGYNMFEELKKCDDLLEKYGGHEMAAGLSIRKDNIKNFSKRLNDNLTLSEDDLIKKIWIDVPMYAEYADEKLIGELACLEPFGVGNKKPVFADKDLEVADVKVLGQNQNVLRLKLRTPRGKTVEAIKFLNGDGEQIPKTGDILAITYYPEINEFNGYRNVQLRIDEYEM